MTVPRAIVLEGRGLPRGGLGIVRLSSCVGPTTIVTGGEAATLNELRCAGGALETRAVWPNGGEVATVEHLFAAIAGAGAFDGLRVEVEGDEVPLMDGGAAQFFDAIAELTEGAAPPSRGWRVTRGAAVPVADAVYLFEPGEQTSLTVDVAFPIERFGRAVAGVASWNGDSTAFRASIAPSRTFGAARDLARLREAGRASHVPEGCVVAVDLDDPRWAARDGQEPIRHKLLDLIGDLASLGGPLIGGLRALRPSHRASHEALARARDDGTIVRVNPVETQRAP